MWNVIFLGLVSFFADISSEMVYPIIPLYLTTVFGATPALIGLIEGISESLASLLKVYSGYFTDKYKKKKPVAFLGYATGLIYKILLLIATSWYGVLFARVIDRVGKGIRTAPRDVMISESANKGEAGKAFGIHKSLDMAGSAIGILIAFLLLKNSQNGFDYKKVFILSIIPAIIGLVMFVKIKEKKDAIVISPRENFWKNLSSLDGQLKLYLVVAFLFTLGNSSNAFLLLRAKSVGFDDKSVIILYFLYNVIASIFAIPAGKRSDMIGRKRVLVGGYIIFSICYLGFAFAFNKIIIIALFALYGLFTAMITGAERAYISEISPLNLKGTMLGLHSTVVGIALLPASGIAGGLWTMFGPKASFLFGSSMSLIAAILLINFMRTNRQINGAENQSAH